MEIKVAVKDASVLIDLAYGDLIGHWFALGIDTYTTDAVYTQVKAGSHAGVIEKFVDAGLLKIDQISSDDALEWYTKVQSYSDTLNISFADASALICAEDKSALLLIPLGKDPIAADPYATSLITRREKREQHFPFFPGLLHIPQIIKDDHLEAIKPLQ